MRPPTRRYVALSRSYRWQHANPPEQTFCKADLPKETRVIQPGSMVTKDYKPERLNIHVKEDGTVSHVAHG